MSITKILSNQQGLTLIEMLIAILLFILSSIFITTSVSTALDKPKVAGILSTLDSYELPSTLLLRELPDTTDISTFHLELNNSLEVKAQFASTGSSMKNPYKQPYTLEILKDTTQTTFIISTVGKSEEYVYEVAIVREGDTVESCTNGFGQKDRELITLTSPICDRTVATIP